MTRIELIVANKRRYLSLLLLADPAEVMIDRYLDDGALYVLFAGQEPACVAVVTEETPAECELKNLATAEALQGLGYGSRMLAHLFGVYRGRYAAMLVGTSPAGVPFYERFGFRYAFTRAGFFTKHYPEPIYEQGALCTDMTVLRRPL